MPAHLPTSAAPTSAYSTLFDAPKLRDLQTLLPERYREGPVLMGRAP